MNAPLPRRHVFDRVIGVYLSTTPATLPLDAIGRRVAAARVAGDLDRDDCDTFCESWFETNFSRLMLRRGTP